MNKFESIKLKYIVISILMIFIFGCGVKYKRINVLSQKEEEKKAERIKSDSIKKKKKANFRWLFKPTVTEELKNYGIKDGKGIYLMNLGETEIPHFIDSMMSQVFKLNFLIGDKVKRLKKKFTLRMAEHLTRDKAFNVFRKVLELHNVIMKKEEGVYVFSISNKIPFTFKGPIIYGRKVPDSITLNENDEVTFLIPLYNVTPKMFTGLVKKQMSSISMMVPLVESNSILINGKFREIKYLLSFIELMDRAQFKNKSIAMISPKYWDIDDFIKKVKVLLEAEGIKWKSVDKIKSLVFVPIENLNYTLVISPVKQWVERIMFWLNKLDIPEAAGESQRVFCYKLRNVEVATVMEVLKAYRQNNKKSKKPTGPGMQREPEQKNLIAIKETNSIAIVANPIEYKKYLDILKKIDVPRNQVFIEVIIGEVSIDNSSQLGMEFWINKYLYKTEFGTKGGLGVSKGGSDGGLSLSEGSNGFVRGVLSGTQYELLLNALVSNNKINIVSSPKITTVENKEAELGVGSEIPTVSSESGYGGRGTFANNNQNQSQSQSNNNYYPYRSINYVSTGILTKVKASILSDNKISLELNQEISNAVENKSSVISSPEISKRSIKTTMIVQEGQIAFIGGLFQNQSNSGRSGVPFLSKIPILGNLFKKSASRVRKTELVMFINAKIIRKSSEMRNIVDGIKRIISDYSYLED